MIPRRRPPQLLVAAFVIACGLNLYGLFAPAVPGPEGGVPGLDKVAHLGSFALVMLTGMLIGLGPRILAPILVVHAFASELIQHTALPNRAGDLWDVVANVSGIAVGWLAARAYERLRCRCSNETRPASRT